VDFLISMPDQFTPYNPDDQGTTPQQTPYQNPSQPSNLNPTFGESDQFNIPGGVVTPFNFGQQREEGANWLSGFSEFLGGQEKLPAIQQRYENRYGIPDLQENYLRQKEAQDMVGNKVRGLEKDVGQRFSESMLTQGQISNVVNSEAKGLLEQFNQLGEITESTGRRLALQEQNLNSAARLELAQMEKDTLPWLKSYDSMNIMQAREFSGWGTTQSLELQRLLGNQASGLTWDNSEAQRASNLLIAEKGFQNELDKISAKNEFYLDMWG